MYHRVAESKLPTIYGQFRIIVYEDYDTIDIHIVLVRGNIKDKETVICRRIHSSCITSEAFGSYKCDCGEQIHESLNIISKKGGVIIYLF